MAACSTPGSEAPQKRPATLAARYPLPAKSRGNRRRGVRCECGHARSGPRTRSSLAGSGQRVAGSRPRLRGWRVRSTTLRGFAAWKLGSRSQPRFLAAILRSDSLRCRLRRRTALGVTSTSSSSEIHSIASSRLITLCGLSLIASSAVAERMLVSCFGLAGVGGHVLRPGRSHRRSSPRKRSPRSR